jgi:hypothetical protein
LRRDNRRETIGCEEVVAGEEPALPEGTKQVPVVRKWSNCFDLASVIAYGMERVATCETWRERADW